MVERGEWEGKWTRGNEGEGKGEGYLKRMGLVVYGLRLSSCWQMANSAEVLHQVLHAPPQAPASVAYNFLVPNMKGFENFVKAHGPGKTMSGIASSPPPPPSAAETAAIEEAAPITSTSDPNEMSTTSGQRAESYADAGSANSNSDTVEISLFAAATEAFSKANTNCTIAESLQRFEPIVSSAKSSNIRVRGYVSVALGCPYEGPDVSPSRVADITRALLAMGVDEVSVADTTGMGTAPKTRELLKAILGAGVSTNDLALHFHDTYGQALVNVVIGLEHGIRTFDSSVSGLGGCPYSKGATGNVATEDLLHCLHSLGLKTGVSLDKMAEVGGWISKELGRANDSRSGKAVLARLSQT